MERIQKAGDVRRSNEAQERDMHDVCTSVRALADLELMLVAGGDEIIDWGVTGTKP